MIENGYNLTINFSEMAKQMDDNKNMDDKKIFERRQGWFGTAKNSYFENFLIISYTVTYLLTTEHPEGDSWWHMDGPCGIWVYAHVQLVIQMCKESSGKPGGLAVAVKKSEMDWCVSLAPFICVAMLL